MPEIRIAPSGILSLAITTEDQLASFQALYEAFRVDWREGLFLLAAKGDAAFYSPTMRYWHRLAADYLTRICHTPNPVAGETVEPPIQSEFETWAMAAPPMIGGEYLTPALLAKIWTALAQWGNECIVADGGVEAFLRKRAPRWNQVGRVTFHLAENKTDEMHPFAFMASFTTGVGASGKIKHLPLSKALELYAGSGNKAALIKLLSPVDAAANRCEWVRELVDHGDIYRPMAWSVQRAYTMLRSSLLLEESGLSVRLPDWWKKRPRPRVNAVIGESRQSRLGVEAMLDFRISVALGDETLTPKELRALLSSTEGLVLFKGQWVEVDRERLQQAIDHWGELERQAEDGQVSFIQGMRLLAGAAPDLKDDAHTEEERQWAHAVAGPGLQEVLERLRNPTKIPVAETSALRTTLRPYQQVGAAWLCFLTELGLGACLADDMGLGKTIQVLALLARQEQKRPKRPSLLVIPASLIGNWRIEAERFAPDLKLLFLHPSEMGRTELDSIARDHDRICSDYDLAVTTYSMLGRTPWLAEQQWRFVILDEAQAIKNHSTTQSKVARKLIAHARIALTGTPVENRLGDLWSLFDFLNPGLLGTAGQFKHFVKEMEGRENDTFGPLRRLVSPYILRRLKTDRLIIADLPDKTEAIRYCCLTKEQVKCYQQAVQAMGKALDEVEGIARKGLVLQTLMRLKQICNHPSQFTGDGEYAPGKSGKFARLVEICEELAERQEKVLVFTQFREIIPALEERLATVFGQPGLVLHGATEVKKRKAIVDLFQREDGPPFFVLSLKAGGTGLNLTAASHVIHFDRWWNPAVENQATDRAFRIGQQKNVLVHKFVTSGTIEERIDKLIGEKQELAEQLLSGRGEVRLTELPDDELLRLVRLDVSRATIS